MEVGDYMSAWGGVAGLQLALPVVWTEASARGHTLADIVRWMCAGPARLAGLTGKKGVIAAGADANDSRRWVASTVSTLSGPRGGSGSSLTAFEPFFENKRLGLHAPPFRGSRTVAFRNARA